MMSGLIGREAEQAILLDFLQNAGSGGGGLLLVSGEEGVGKTALVEETLAGIGRRPLRVRGGEDTGLPFGMLFAVLRAVNLRAGGAASSCRFFLAPLARLLPRLRLDTPGDGAEAFEASDTELSAERILNALICLLAVRENEEPGVLFVEDLHRSDEGSLDLFPVLIDRLAPYRLPIIGTCSAGNPSRGGRLRRLRSELRRNRCLRELRVEPLAAEACREMMRRAIGGPPSPRLMHAVTERSGGVPFFLGELAECVVSRGLLVKTDAGFDLVSDAEIPLPESVRDAVALRIGELSPSAQRRLYAASLLGPEFHLNELFFVQGRETDPGELLASGLIVTGEGERARFRHSLVREAVREEIPWGMRGALHAGIAEMLEAAGAHPERIARHWLEAGRHDRARDLFLEALRLFDGMGAHRDAARTARLALASWRGDADSAGRLDLLERLGRCARLSGELEEAERIYLELADHPEVRRDARRCAAVNRELATVAGVRGREQVAYRARRAAEEAFRRAGNRAEAAVELLNQVANLTGTLRLQDAVDAARSAAELAGEETRDDIRARALGIMGHLLAMRGRFDEARAAVEKGLSLALARNLPAVAAELYRRLGGVMEYSSDFAGAAQLYSTAIGQCRQHGAEVAAYDCMGCMSYLMFRVGDWARSLEICRTIFASPLAPLLSVVTARCTVALVHTARGEVRAARRALAEAEEQVRASGFGLFLLFLRWTRALLLEQTGERKAAAAEYRHLVEDVLRSEDLHDNLPSICHAAAVFADTGAESDLSACADFAGRIAALTGNHEAFGAVSFCVGSVDLSAGRYEEAASSYREAYRRFESVGVPLEQARAACQAGIAYRRAGAFDDARRWLEEARTIARRLSARPLAAFAGDAASDVSGRAGTAAAGSDRRGTLLSPRQTEVARLLAAGLSNKEIAARLYLSPRTVEMHIAHLFDRLDCRSRAEAVRRIVDLGFLEKSVRYGGDDAGEKP